LLIFKKEKEKQMRHKGRFRAINLLLSLLIGRIEMIRKAFLLILSLSVIGMLTTISVSYSITYTVRQITDNSYDDLNPQINVNGFIVWEQFDGQDVEIIRYNGTVASHITSNSYDDIYPQINDNGYVVWSGSDGSDYEIFLYNGTSITQLTNNSYDDWEPQINNNGYVVWYGSDGSDDEIFLYNGTSITQLTDNPYEDWYPQINNNGDVVWQGYDGSDWEIFLYDGTKTIQLTDNSYDDYDPQINDNGDVVWYGSDGSDWEIFLYNGTSITQLTDNSYDDYDPQINDNGDVVWYGSDGSDWEIFLYNGTSITQLTDNSYDDYDPQINNSGYVVWSGNNEIFLYNGTKITQITNNFYNDYNPQINDNGDVVWYGYDGSDNEIFLATSGQVISVLNLLTPNGGEVIPSGSIYTIQWSASGEAVNFKLKYSMNNGSTWKLIDSGITGASYEWTVPTPKKSKNKCLVKVIGFNLNGKKVAADKSAPFTIEVLKLTSPDGGEILTSDNTHTITWTTNITKNPVMKVKLLYTKNGGATWKPITTITGSNPESFDWTVPTVTKEKTNCKVKVVLKDISGITVGKDVSDSSFTIQP
jgi:hypothetical protein